jgi:hypothetical protein
VPKKAPPKPKPLYRRKPPRRVASVTWQVTGKAKAVGRDSVEPKSSVPSTLNPLARRSAAETAQPSTIVLPHAHPIAPSHFTLREDGTIEAQSPICGRTDDHSPSPGGEGRGEGGPSVPKLTFSSDTPFLRLYHGNSLELLDAIAAKYPDGRFDAIFADPPYFLSNGGITCHAGKMVKVDKGDWDVSRGPELNHEFNTEWLRRCQRVLKPNGTIWDN